MYVLVVVGTSITRLRTSMRPTHLMLLIPTQPGTIARTGKPWSGGTGWRPATLREPNIPRAWTRWDIEWDARPGEHTILTRAADDQGGTQPARVTWNAQGYGYNVPVPHPLKVV